MVFFFVIKNGSIIWSSLLYKNGSIDNGKSIVFVMFVSNCSCEVSCGSMYYSVGHLGGKFHSLRLKISLHVGQNQGR